MTRSPGLWLALVAGVIVASAVVAGLLVVGGPGTARLEKLDRERLDDLHRIRNAVAYIGHVPASLDSLVTADRLTDADLTDPETGERYAYRVLTDSTYEVCTTFALSSENSSPRS